MRGANTSVVGGERYVAIDHLAERVRSAMLGDERLSTPNDVEAALLAFIARRTPRREAVPAQNASDRCRIRSVKRGNVEPELEARPTPVDPENLVPETTLGELRAIDRCRKGDDRVGMKMVDVHRIDECMHRGVDAGRGASAAEEAVVEQTHHFVFVFRPAVDTDQALDSAELENRQPGLRSACRGRRQSP